MFENFEQWSLSFQTIETLWNPIQSKWGPLSPLLSHICTSMSEDLINWNIAKVWSKVLIVLGAWFRKVLIIDISEFFFFIIPKSNIDIDFIWAHIRKWFCKAEQYFWRQKQEKSLILFFRFNWVNNTVKMK